VTEPVDTEVDLDPAEFVVALIVFDCCYNRKQHLNPLAVLVQVLEM
jgi:hypothetical protein